MKLIVKASRHPYGHVGYVRRSPSGKMVFVGPKGVKPREKTEEKELASLPFAPYSDTVLSLLNNDRWDLGIKKEDHGYGAEYVISIKPAMVPGVETYDRGFGHEAFYDSSIAAVKESDYGPAAELKPESGYLDVLPEDVKAGDAGHMYRGISNEEMVSIVESGKIQSHGDYNLGEQQVGLTFFGAEGDQAAYYASGFQPYPTVASFTRPAFLLKVRKPDDSRIDYDAAPAREYGVKGSIPVSDIVEVWELRPYDITPGYVEVVPNIQGKYTEGSRSSPSARIAYRKVDLENLLGSSTTGVLPAPLKTLTADDVVDIEKRSNAQGKQEGFSMGASYKHIRDKGGSYVLIDVPVSMLDHDFDRPSEISEAQKYRADEYAKKDTDPPPIRIGHSNTASKKGKRKAFVANGNHRVAAAVLRGEKTILAVIPADDYRRWNNTLSATVKKSTGPYIGPRGGKWADPQHTIPWRGRKSKKRKPGVVGGIFGPVEISDAYKQSIATSFEEAGRSVAAYEQSFRDALNSLPLGYKIGKWEHVDLAGDHFWTDSKKWLSANQLLKHLGHKMFEPHIPKWYYSNYKKSIVMDLHKAGITPKDFMVTVMTESGHVKKIGDGKFGARLVTFNNGIRATLKPQLFDTSPYRGIDRSTQYLREAAAYQLDTLLNFGVVPPTTMTMYKKSPASIQQWVVGVHSYGVVPEVFKKSAPNWKKRVALFAAKVNIEQLRKVVLFDLIVNNTDRHARNCLFDTFTNKVWAIDNGLAFGRYYRYYYSVFHKFLFRKNLILSQAERETLEKVTPTALFLILRRYLRPREIEETFWRIRWMLEQPNLGFEQIAEGDEGRDDFPSKREWFEQQLRRGQNKVLTAISLMGS